MYYLMDGKWLNVWYDMYATMTIRYKRQIRFLKQLIILIYNKNNKTMLYIDCKLVVPSYLGRKYTKYGMVLIKSARERNEI